MAEHSLINTSFPVMLPEMPELRLDRPELEAYIKSLVTSTSTSLPIRTKEENTTVGSRVGASASVETENVTSAVSGIPAGAKDGSNVVESRMGSSAAVQRGNVENEAPFMKALLADKVTVPSLDDRDGKMLTENADVAYRDSGEALIDLFFELEDVISADRLKTVLEKAWKHDPQATLTIIWNARSIHLGKSSRYTFYRAVGWLAEHHPLTLLVNLPWLVRPLISKKAPKKDEKGEPSAQTTDATMADSDFEIVEKEELEGQPEQKKLKLDKNDLDEFDVKYGVSHGYWKDLLNILALAANDQLKVDGDPRSVLNVEKPTEKKYKRDWTEGRKKIVHAGRHTRVMEKLGNDGFYKALHLSVARLFADQLKTDLTRLQSGQKTEAKRITLAAKWAPSHKGMHDQYTCIVSSIAELLHGFEDCCPKDVDPADRELYLKHARVAYQSKTLSPLRNHLNVVERDITAETFDQIKYERVPSLAMARYTPLFAKKDFAHFDKYVDSVAAGKSRISGATLLPSTLVAAVRKHEDDLFPTGPRRKAKGADMMVQKKLRDIQLKTVDGQWHTLVRRIKESGQLESSIAICDVSGSMSYPRFADGTCPMDSSIGLSLLLAEVTQPPFGGAFITFSDTPQVLRVGGRDDKRSLEEKVRYIYNSNWSMNTDFVAVFEKLILPMAVENKLSQDDMVKQVFVFSDMQFDACGGDDRWTTSYERIQKQFKEAGYEMPRLIFWNLAGGRAGYGVTSLTQEDLDRASDAAPKPVTAAEEGTALVSGYSQGQMKMFLENGSFEDPEDDEATIDCTEGTEDEVVVEKEKKKQDPLAVVKRAISHEAYRMLKVVD